MFARFLRCLMFVLFGMVAAMTLGDVPAAAAGVDVSVAPRVPVRLEARGAARPI